MILAKWLEHFALRLHPDPESRLVHAFLNQVGESATAASNERLAWEPSSTQAWNSSKEWASSLKRHWAEYLTVLATVLLLPLEL